MGRYTSDSNLLILTLQSELFCGAVAVDYERRTMNCELTGAGVAE
jgi:hypothetical protein